MTPPLNILWICTDSQRWDTLGCTGNRHVRTPNLDRMAAEGALMTSCFAQSPLCQPSRGGFLTGRYAAANRLRRNGQRCPPDLDPVPRWLRAAGYRCGLAGKLHLSAADHRLVLGEEWWRRPPEAWVGPGEERIDDGYEVFEWDHAPAYQPERSAYAAWLRERGMEFRRTPLDDCRFVDWGMPAAVHPTTWCLLRAGAFVESQPRDQPWLFSANVFAPHYRFDPPPEMLGPWLERLDGVPLPAVVPGELDRKPLQQREWCEKGHGYAAAAMTDRDRRLVRAAYWAQVEHIDAEVGRLMRVLDRSPHAGRTLVLFMSDHGEMLGDHGLTTKGPALYDPALRVPLIAWAPGVVRAGLRSDALVELNDLAPTVADAAGVKPPPGTQAQSLWPWLTGATSEVGREDVYADYLDGNPHRPPHYLSMVRTRTHKLVASHHSADGELYDLERDPGEHVNLWDDPGAADIRFRLLQRLAARQAGQCDPMPERVGVF